MYDVQLYGDEEDGGHRMCWLRRSMIADKQIYQFISRTPLSILVLYLKNDNGISKPGFRACGVMETQERAGWRERGGPSVAAGGLESFIRRPFEVPSNMQMH